MSAETDAKTDAKRIANNSEPTKPTKPTESPPTAPPNKNRPREQKSRANQSVDNQTVMNYTMARAWLYGMWFGATLMIMSFAGLYFWGLAPDNATAPIIISAIILMAIGAFAYLKNKRYYQELDFPYGKKWERAAMIVAASAAVFWTLFVLAMFLVWRGIPLF